MPGSVRGGRRQAHNDRRVSQLDRTLRAETDEHGGALDNYFERAHSVVLLTANAPAFEGALAEPGATAQKVRRHCRNLADVTPARICGAAVPGHREALEQAAGDALSETGEGFAIATAFGTVVIPHDTRDVTEAIRQADNAMYAQKHSGRATAGRQSTDVLLRALAERHPDLGDHLDGVTELAEQVAERLGIDGEDLTQLRHAAALHDIGKVAIPDAIIHKPAALSDDEWAFMRRHTIIGERIIAAAPALGPAARLVRASHEAFDGSGYPDRLANTRIPLGARIIAVCDAFDAMISDRPYSKPKTTADALAELRRCAGTQFDPAIVPIFEQIIAERARRPLSTPA